MSIYMVKEVKANDKRSDGSEILETGEWEVLEHFNMTLIAKVYLARKYADKIVESLNNEDNPEFKNGDLISLAFLIRRYLKEWIGQNTVQGKTGNTIGHYNDAVNCVLGRIMKDSCGNLNPVIVEQLIRLERVAWNGTDIQLPC